MKAKGYAERLIATKILKEVGNRRLAGVKGQLSEAHEAVANEQQARLAVLSQLADARRSFEKERKERAAQTAICATHWRKQVQLAAVDRILSDRKYQEEHRRVEDLQAYLEAMANMQTQAKAMQEVNDKLRRDIEEVSRSSTPPPPPPPRPPPPPAAAHPLPTRRGSPSAPNRVLRHTLVHAATRP